MTKVLEQLELTICALGKDWSAEWLHDLLDGHSLAGELVLGRTKQSQVGRARWSKFIIEME